MADHQKKGIIGVKKRINSLKKVVVWVKKGINSLKNMVIWVKKGTICLKKRIKRVKNRTKGQKKEISSVQTVIHYPFNRLWRSELPCSGFFYLGGRRIFPQTGLRKERFAKRLVEFVAALEIVAAVLLGLREERVLHHVENKLAKILAAANAPRLEHRHRHRAVLLERELADAGEQLLAADVARHIFLRGLAQGLLRVVERFADEVIGLAGVTRVFGQDFFELFVEVDSVHR